MASPEAIDTALFRGALGLFATGVTVVTASHADAGLIGITANSFNSVSLDPPLVLFSIANHTKSLTPFLETRSFAVNVLRKEQKLLAGRFARAGEDKWAGIRHVPGRFGAPILSDTIAAFDCVHYAQYEGGDHVIIVGRVIALEHDRDGDPLLFFRGRYRSIGDEVA